MPQNTSTMGQTQKVDLPIDIAPFSSLDPAITHGSVAVAIILALAVLMRALASLVKSCQD